jgi:hypothetical protein
MRRTLFSSSKVLQPRLLAIVVPFLAGILLLAMYGIASAETERSCRQSIWMNSDQASSDNPIVVSIKDLRNSPEWYYGKMVTVDGELNQDFADNIFTIEGSGSSDEDILVISTVSKAESVVPLQRSLERGKKVRITGLVQPYGRGRLECAYGPLHLESREGHSFTQNPVLIIDKTRSTGSAMMPSQGVIDCRQSLLMDHDETSKANPIVVSMKELQRLPEQYYGKTVTVHGELHRDFTDKIFTIQGSGFRDEDVLVISTVSKVDTIVPLQHSLERGKVVRVTGLVLPYDRGRLECAYGPLNLESREGHSFTKNPVLIIDRTPTIDTAMTVPEAVQLPIKSAPPAPELAQPEAPQAEPAAEPAAVRWR